MDTGLDSLHAITIVVLLLPYGAQDARVHILHEYQNQVQNRHGDANPGDAYNGSVNNSK